MSTINLNIHTIFIYLPFFPLAFIFLQPHPNPIFRNQTNPRYNRRLKAHIWIQPKAGDQLHHHDHTLGHGQIRPNTTARSIPKRQVSFLRVVVSLNMHKPLWTKRIRILPNGFAPIHHRQRHQYRAIRRNHFSFYSIGLGAGSVDKRDYRIQPQDFLKHAPTIG